MTQHLNSVLSKIPMQDSEITYAQKAFNQLKQILRISSPTTEDLPKSVPVENLSEVVKFFKDGLTGCFREAQSWMQARKKTIERVRDVAAVVRESRTRDFVAMFFHDKPVEWGSSYSGELKTNIEKAQETFPIDRNSYGPIGDWYNKVLRLQSSLLKIFGCDILEVLFRDPKSFQALSDCRHSPDFAKALQTFISEVFGGEDNGIDPCHQAVVTAIVLGAFFANYRNNCILVSVYLTSPMLKIEPLATLEKVCGALNAINLSDVSKNDNQQISLLAEELQKEMQTVKKVLIGLETLHLIAIGPRTSISSAEVTSP